MINYLDNHDRYFYHICIFKTIDKTEMNIVLRDATKVECISEAKKYIGKDIMIVGTISCMLDMLKFINYKTISAGIIFGQDSYDEKDIFIVNDSMFVDCTQYIKNLI